MRPKQNGRHFADDIFKCIFVNENVWIPIKILLKFVPKGPINNIPAMAQIMAWRRPGDKPLSETMMVSLPTHICVARPQWVNTMRVRQNGSHCADYIFKCTFSEKWISSEIVFQWVQLTIHLHWFRLWFGTVEYSVFSTAISDARLDCIRSFAGTVMATIDICNTVRCRYNAVNFLTNIHKRRPIRRGMGVFCGPNIWLILCLSYGIIHVISITII